MTQRVYRADETSEAPRRPLPERQRAEAAELVEVRALLCELRPGGGADTGGPLGWSPLAPEPRHEEPRQGALARRIRVQTSVGPSDGPSDGPRDAFAADAGVTRGVEVDRAIRAVGWAGGEEPARTLTWLQRCGTLAEGLAALYVAAGHALATVEQQARWASRPATLADEARRQRGREAVLYALRWWRGERPVCGGQTLGCWPSTWGGAECWEVAARCQRPETMRARGPRCRRCA